MKKLKFLGFVLVSAVCIITLAGASLCFAAGPKAKIKPCEVKLVNMENIYLGKDSICLSPYFEVSNPNNFPVAIDELTYEILLKDFVVDGKTLPKYYIPAKGKITLMSAFAMEWPHLAMYSSSFQGREMGEGIQVILPLWKGMNGQLFNPKLKEAWDKITPEYPEFTAKGKIDTIGPKKQKTTSEYSTTYKQSLDYKLYK
jgi:LEA14-like dessication related protein